MADEDDILDDGALGGDWTAGASGGARSGNQETGGDARRQDGAAGDAGEFAVSSMQL